MKLIYFNKTAFFAEKNKQDKGDEIKTYRYLKLREWNTHKIKKHPLITDPISAEITLTDRQKFRDCL